MPIPGQNKTVIFTHIPKTAGNTINLFLQRHYLFRKGILFNPPNMQVANQLFSLPEKSLKNITVIRGHLNFIHPNNFPSEVQYFTMLREPLSRAVSHYNYMAVKATHVARKAFLKGVSLKQVLDEGLIKNIDNCQVRFLCGEKDITYGEVSHDHLDKAISNLENYYKRVGIMEFFDASVLLFAKYFNWRTPYYTRQNENKTPGIRLSDLDNITMEALKDANKYDIILYEKALQLFHQQVNNEGENFPEELELFKNNNEKKKNFITALTFLLKCANQAKIYLKIEKRHFLIIALLLFTKSISL